MNATEARTRLLTAERHARSHGDATYGGAVALADPGTVRGADDVPSARALMQEFCDLADAMAGQDVDSATLGDALDLAGAEADVVEAARAVERAEQEVADAESDLAAAERAAAAAETEAEKSAAAARVAAAEEALEEAMRKLARARSRLAEALAEAADHARSMREGLERRHGDLDEAHAAAEHPAERGFYEREGR